jgi:hypothetical protein
MVPFALRRALDAWPRPYLGYGMCEAAEQAMRHGIPRLVAVEFGVGRGDGLLILEGIASELERHFDVRWDVVGFDLGSGLPEPTDYRDCPYIWQKGHYEMDVPAVRSRLRRAELILGPVASTVPTFVATLRSPVGFVSFDLDFYSSTRDAMVLLDAAPELLLPRTFCYFDDIVGPDAELHNHFAGELLAIDEFNASHTSAKLAKIHGLQHKRVAPCLWSDQMFVLHRFDHPEYGRYTYADAVR